MSVGITFFVTGFSSNVLSVTRLEMIRAKFYCGGFQLLLHVRSERPATLLHARGALVLDSVGRTGATLIVIFSTTCSESE